jgi:hypothetical protein
MNHPLTFSLSNSFNTNITTIHKLATRSIAPNELRHSRAIIRRDELRKDRLRSIAFGGISMEENGASFLGRGRKASDLSQETGAAVW